MSTEHHGTFCWNELMTTDPAGAAAFLAAIGRYDEVREMPMPGGGTYRVLVKDGRPAGGIMAIPPELTAAGVPPHWGSYLAVDDVDATVARAVELGGRVVEAGFDVPDVGRIAVIADPQGAVLHLMTPVR
jgi:uncharacterized protein